MVFLRQAVRIRTLQLRASCVPRPHLLCSPGPELFDVVSYHVITYVPRQVTARVTSPPALRLQAFDSLVDQTCMEDQEKKAGLFSKVRRRLAPPLFWTCQLLLPL